MASGKQLLDVAMERRVIGLLPADASVDVLTTHGSKTISVQNKIVNTKVTYETQPGAIHFVTNERYIVSLAKVTSSFTRGQPLRRHRRWSKEALLRLRPALVAYRLTLRALLHTEPARASTAR